MKRPLTLRPEAVQDLTSARIWYEAQRAGLGDAFIAQLDAALEQIAERPEMYALKWMDVRLCRMRRFPHLIYYRFLEDRVEVLAVLHGSQHPETGLSRI